MECSRDDFILMNTIVRSKNNSTHNTNDQDSFSSEEISLSAGKKKRDK